jgi:hypothetical protein
MKKVLLAAIAATIGCSSGPSGNIEIPEAGSQVTIPQKPVYKKIKDFLYLSEIELACLNKQKKDNAPENGYLRYLGGPVMSEPTNVYIIWYGNWDGNTAKEIIPEFIKNLSDSDYMKMNTGYYSMEKSDSGVDSGDSDVYSGPKTFATSTLKIVKQIDDHYSQGKTLGENYVKNLVVAAIDNGDFPVDKNGLYTVLTSNDVEEGSTFMGFCTWYCGYHDVTDYKGTKIKFTFTGDGTRCPTDCISSNQTYSPNNNIGADGMVSVIAHEYSEMISDPELNAWMDSVDAENADKCAWVFGPSRRLENCSFSNLNLNGKNYLVQQNWVNADIGYCSMK